MFKLPSSAGCKACCSRLISSCAVPTADGGMTISIGAGSGNCRPRISSIAPTHSECDQSISRKGSQRPYHGVAAWSQEASLVGWRRRRNSSQCREHILSVRIHRRLHKKQWHPRGCIRMDIEGGEGDALRGTVKTLRDIQARLMISAYHRNDDLWVLRDQTHKINPNDRFHLGHHTPVQ